MAICSVCKIEMLEEDVTVWTGARTVHLKCRENLTDDLLPPSPEEIKRVVLKENSTGTVITDIDLPWGSVFFTVFQYLVVLNIILIPFYLIFMIATQ